MSDVWQQQPNETAKAYHAFCVYRDLGAERSLSKVRERLGKRSGYDRQLEEWSSQHTWGDRVAAYDRKLDERLTAEFEEQLIARRRTLLELEIKHADVLLAKFDETLERVKLHSTKSKPSRKKDGDKEVDIVLVSLNIEDLRELTLWRRDLAALTRLTVGLPGNIAQGQHTGKDGGPLKIEWVSPLEDDDDIGVGADEFPPTD